MRNARQSPPSADLQQGSESHGVMRVGPVPSGNLESSPSCRLRRLGSLALGVPISVWGTLDSSYARNRMCVGSIQGL